MAELELPKQPAQSPFIMTSVPLPGKEKAAILFTELGSKVTNPMLKYFSTKELKKLRKAIAKLPPYDVGDTLQALQRAANYGISRGIYVELPHEEPITPEQQQMNTVRDMISGAPSDVAQILGSWLQQEDE